MFARHEEISLAGRRDPGPTYLRYVTVADPGFPTGMPQHFAEGGRRNLIILA